MQAPPVPSAREGTLSFTRVNTYPYTPTPIPAWAVPETYDELLGENCTLWRNETSDGLALSNCNKCGWKRIQDWPEAQTMPSLYSNAGRWREGVISLVAQLPTNMLCPQHSTSLETAWTLVYRALPRHHSKTYLGASR